MDGADPRAPVIVGTGQVSAKGEEDASPLGLMAEAARRAAADSGAGDALLSGLDTIAVPHTFSWPLEDPGRFVGEELGVEPGETVRSAIGGTAPLVLLADACERIAAGERDAVLVTGGEAVNPFMRAMAGGKDAGWPTEEPGTRPDRLLPGDPAAANHAREMAANLIAPISYYPLFEHALRAEAGRSIAEHQLWLGELWSRVGAAARENPHAWTRDVPGAEELSTPAQHNRMAMHPYTKLLTANIQVDQGAAFAVCSLERARELGVSDDAVVFVRSLAHATDHWFVGERERLDRSPAIAACGEAALGHARLAADEIDHLDLYSCFPSAVQIAARELGIDPVTDSRPLSVTGGLTFAGGPANNYCAHSLATAAGRLRSDPGSALLSGVGWYMTKHAVAVLTSEPPSEPFRRLDVQEAVDRLPKREIAEEPEGRATVESFTLAYERDGSPSVATVSCLLGDGTRAFVKSDRGEVIDALLARDPIGDEVALSGGELSI